MSGVIIGVEPYKVAVKDTKQQLVSNGQDSVDLATGERRMKEESDLDILLAVPNLFPEHLRK